MTPKTFFTGLGLLALAAAILLLGHYGLGWVAALAMFALAGVGWFKGGRSITALLAQVPQLLLSLSVITLISLNQPPVGQPVFPVVTQLLLALGFAIWVTVSRQLVSPQSQLIVAAVNQVLAMMAIFLAAAFWQWSDLLVVAVTWIVSTLNGWWLLEARGERAAHILAATWGLINGQLAWVLYTWQVNYRIGDDVIIIPQAAIVSLGVGYCLVSIYLAHSQKRLSRRRLVEYVAIAGVLLAIVIAGTRWNGMV